MKTYPILILGVLFLNTLLRTEPVDDVCCKAGFVLIPKHQKISVFKDKEGTILAGYIINDTISENYFGGVIYEIKNGFSRISGSYTFKGGDIEGWVQSKYLGTYLADLSNVHLYVAPCYSSTKERLENPEWYPMSIIKCYKSWVYIIYKDHYQEKSGWLPPEFVSSNPYTISN